MLLSTNPTLHLRFNLLLMFLNTNLTKHLNPKWLLLILFKHPSPNCNNSLINLMLEIHSHNSNSIKITLIKGHKWLINKSQDSQYPLILTRLIKFNFSNKIQHSKLSSNSQNNCLILANRNGQIKLFKINSYLKCQIKVCTRVLISSQTNPMLNTYNLNLPVRIKFNLSLEMMRVKPTYKLLKILALKIKFIKKP